MCSKGVADQQLADAEAARKKIEMESERPRSPPPDPSHPVSDSESVSTISTNRSRTRSPTRSQEREDRFLTSGHASRRRSKTSDVPRKRKYRSISSSCSQSPGSPRRESNSHRKSRRHRTISPVDRGRPNSMRRGSRRSRTNSLSLDKSQIAMQRRSLDVEVALDTALSGNRRDHADENRPPLPQIDFRFGGGMQSREGKERSLSPFSKRLALTQAMNM